MKKNLRRCCHSALIVLLCLALSGCGSEWKRKFVRKKSQAQQDQVFVYEPKEYDRGPNDDIYKKYYIFWRAWMEELINKLGANRMADLRGFEEMQKNLEEMRSCLKDDKAAELDIYTQKLRDYYTDYKNGDFDVVRSRQMRGDLDRLKLKMDKIFRYNRVKTSIKKEELVIGNQ